MLFPSHDELTPDLICRQCTRAAAISALLLSGNVMGVEAQTTGTRAISHGPALPAALGHMAHAVAMSEQRVRSDARRATWVTTQVLPGRRWPLRADPRRWLRLFANTTEGTLSFDAVPRRQWWQ